jgi:4-carboxymuconolactone decarboxylase
MRLKQPRITPLSHSEWDGETREVLEGPQRDGRVYHIFATLARHPKLLKRWLVFGNHILSKSALTAREREIAILRMGWLCRAEYANGAIIAGAQLLWVPVGKKGRVNSSTQRCMRT